jgi:hypothetical protein
MAEYRQSKTEVLGGDQRDDHRRHEEFCPFNCGGEQECRQLHYMQCTNDIMKKK